MNRREFSIITLITFALPLFAKKDNETYKNSKYLRPPRSDKNFEKLCVKCGQCLQVCPYHSINLLDINAFFSIGTAYIDPKNRGCYLCDLFPCVLACPSGALNDKSLEKKDANMGVAILVNFKKCLAYRSEILTKEKTKFLTSRKYCNEREKMVIDKIYNSNGEICDLCVKLCPITDNAIKMTKLENNKILPQIKKNCVGCGVCAEVCPEKIIEILPNKKYNEIYKD
ncbi:4Fe-4S dicluster domain-containing protein [Campylobacter hominis]